jgi:superoxide dismutase, Cu-Zn family
MACTRAELFKEGDNMKQTLKLAACAIVLSACATSMQPSGPTATAVMRPASGSQAHGTVKFTQVGTRVRVEAELAALTPGQHGFHLHEKGDCSAPDAASAGAHFNPAGKKHGAPDSKERHAGDLGNLSANEYGKATLTLMVDGISIGKGTDGVIGRSVIVHADADDLKTDPTGNSGDRVACGVIEG